MIIDNLPKQIQAAMKARDTIRLTTLQLLKSALDYERIEKHATLTAADELVVVKKEAKKRKDAIEAYTNAKRDDLVKKEQTELKVLEEFLPEQMPDEELAALIKETISDLGASSFADMGKVIGAVMSQTKGQADGSRVSALVKEALQ